MTPKSGRFRNVDKGERAAPQPRYPVPTRVAAAFRSALPKQRFTLDQYYDRLGHVTVDLRTTQTMLTYFEQTGEVVRDGLLHWRRTKR